MNPFRSQGVGESGYFGGGGDFWVDLRIKEIQGRKRFTHKVKLLVR